MTKAFTSIFAPIPSSALLATPLLIIGGLLMIIALALGIYAILVKIRSGFRYLSRVDSRFRISYTGTTLMIVGLVIVVIGIIALIAMAALLASSETGAVTTSFAVLILGFIVALVGQILTLLIGAFRLHGRYNESLYQSAGILYIIAIIILPPIFGLIAAILMYMALKTTINKLITL